MSSAVLSPILYDSSFVVTAHVVPLDVHTKHEACELIFTFTISALERICSDGLLKACIKFFLVARAIVNLEKSLGAFCGVFLRSTWQLGTVLQRPSSHVLNFVFTRSFF